MTEKRKLLLFFILIWLCVIWGNSLLSREISGAISDFFQMNLNYLFNADSDGKVNSLLLRKFAHFAEFSVLGILLLLYHSEKSRRYIKSFLFGTVAASVDEIIQIFSGRGNSIFDVMIDCTGVLFGIILVYFFEKHIKQKRKDLP